MIYTAKAPAKINLALDVLGRRSNGYHDVAMIMQTIALYDTITIETTEEGISLTTDSPDIPTDRSNIAYRAAEYLKNRYEVKAGVNIHIQKEIPVAAGLAGGSTDAAAVLQLLNKAWQLGLSKEELMAAGLTLGADVPFCIQGGTCLAEGLGEKLTIIDKTPRCYVLLVKPDVGVSTKEVYQNLKLEKIDKRPDIDAMLNSIDREDIPGICSSMANVLETVTIDMHPVIQELKQRLLELGAVGSLMSGSGPTVFGIFEDHSDAQTAYDQLRHLFNEVFLITTFDGRDE